MAQLNFDASTVEPSAPFEVIPAGWYNCTMTASEIVPTGKGDNYYLKVEFTVMDGQYAGRKLWDRLNLKNDNQLAMEIAYRNLSAICHAVGVINVADSQQLHGLPLRVKVKVRPAEKGEDGKEYEASNEITGYEDSDGSTTTATPGAAASAASADDTPAWATGAEEEPEDDDEGYEDDDAEEDDDDEEEEPAPPPKKKKKAPAKKAPAKKKAAAAEAPAKPPWEN